MEYEIRKANDRLFIETQPGSQKLSSERDALDLVAICGEHRISRLMIHSGNLTDDFFRLSTGVAGEILLKFVNYHIQVAAVLTPEQVNQGKFREMVLESNRGNQFRVFFDRNSAEAWLTAG